MARAALNAALVVLGPLASLGLAELGLRALRGGHALLPIYAEGSPPGVLPSVTTVGLLGARRYSVVTDDHGFRAPCAPAGTLLLGDSLAFGLGLDGDDTLAARCTARGHPMRNAAVPGFTAIDALDRGEALGGDELLLIVNPYDDADAALSGRVVVASGWLLDADAPGWVRSVFASPLGAWQIPHDLARIGALVGREDPPRVGFAAVGARVRGFIAAHPNTRVVWGGYPTPTLPDGRVVADLRAEFVASADVAVIDLVLTDAWLDGDLHWSAAGVEQVAAQLCP